MEPADDGTGRRPTPKTPVGGPIAPFVFVVTDTVAEREEEEAEAEALSATRATADCSDDSRSPSKRALPQRAVNPSTRRA